MKLHLEIADIIGREILDSRGNPTVEVEVVLEDGTVGRAAVPSGASTGIYEACELRDGDKSRYNGKGVQTAVKNVNTEIADALIGENVLDQPAIDKKLIELDGTPQQDPPGRQRHPRRVPGLRQGRRAEPGPAAVQLHRRRQRQAAARADDEHLERRRPRHQQRGDPGVHDHARLRAFLPGSPAPLRRGVPHPQDRAQGERHPPPRAWGDEGGYAPNLAKDEDALKVIVQAIEKAGYQPGEDFKIAIDAASSEWWDEEKKCYIQPKSGTKLSQQDLVDMWTRFADTYPIISLEDGMAETDWEGWAMLTKAIGDRVQLVGDDLFVTNVTRLATGIEKHVGNAILIKVNQIGSLTETLDAIQMANRAGYTAIVSHRSGETEGRDHRRHRRGPQRRPDQDRRAQPHGPRGQVQPAPPHRGRTGRHRRVSGHEGLLQPEEVSLSDKTGRREHSRRLWMLIKWADCQSDEKARKQGNFASGKICRQGVFADF